MNNFLKKWNEISLVKRIIVGLIIGTTLALIRPSLGAETHAGNALDSIKILGALFAGGLKAMAPILVFFLVMEALSKHGKGHTTNMKHVVVLYLVGTFMAALAGVVASFLFPVDMILPPTTEQITPPQGLDEVLRGLLMNLVDNPVKALMTPNYIGILFWSVLIGISLKNAKPETKSIISNFADAISNVVRYVISFAPIGIMGLIYDSITTSGIEVFKKYFLIIALLVGTMLVVAFVINPIIVFTQIRQNPYPLVFTCMKRSGVTAFFTRSSAANIPVNMQLCKELGLDEDTYSVSIPLGATINMGGASVTIAVMTIAAAHTLGLQIDIGTAIVLSFLSAMSACGASGVAGGSLLLIPLACSLFGIPADIAAQVVVVGFTIGVIQDSAETAINSATDVLFTATADIVQKRKNGEDINIKNMLDGLVY